MRSIGPDPSKEYTEEELKSYRRWQLLHLIHAWGASMEVLNQISLLETPGLVELALTTQREARQREKEAREQEEARLQTTPRWQLLEYLHQFSDYRDPRQFWALRNATTKALINFVREVRGLNPEPSPAKTDLQDFFTYLRPKWDIHPRRLSSRAKHLHPSVILGFCLALARLKGLEEEVPYIWCIDSKHGLLNMLKRLHEVEDFTRRSDLYQLAKEEVRPEVDIHGVKKTLPRRPLHYREVLSLSRFCMYEVLKTWWPPICLANGVRVSWEGLPLPFLRSMVHASMFHGGPEAWYRKHRLAYGRARSDRVTSFPPWDAVLDEEMDRIERELLDSPVLAAKMRESGLNAQAWVVTHLGRKGLSDTLEFMKKKEKHVPTSTQETPEAHRRSDQEQH